MNREALKLDLQSIATGYGLQQIPHTEWCGCLQDAKAAVLCPKVSLDISLGESTFNPSSRQKMHMSKARCHLQDVIINTCTEGGMRQDSACSACPRHFHLRPEPQYQTKSQDINI